MNKVTIPSYISKIKATTVLQDRLIISTHRKRYHGSDEIAAIARAQQTSARGSSEASLLNLKKKGDGRMSYHIRLRIRRASAIFFQGRSMSHGHGEKGKRDKYMRAAFITLTIPGMEEVIDSKKGYSLMIDKMIHFLKYNFEIRDYIWRFEWQDRGQGHWHIMVDHYCEQEIVRQHWLGLLAGLGLMNEWYKKYSYDPSAACKVKGIKSDSMLSNYLWEYFEKEDQSMEPTEGRWWGGSDTIKKSSSIVVPICEDHEKWLEAKSRKGQAEIFEVKVEKEGSTERPILGDSRGGGQLVVCTVVKAIKVPVIDLLLPFQRDIVEQFRLAYRQGAWKRTWELRDAVLKHGVRWAEWVEHHTEVGRELDELSRLKVHSTPWVRPLTKRQRAIRKRKQQAGLMERQLAGVSLYTWEARSET